MENNMNDLIKKCNSLIATIDKILKDSEVFTDGKLLLDESGFYAYGFSANTQRNYLTAIANATFTLLGDTLSYFTRFTDLYFLRRFLDKDYITNGIIYCGAFHSAVYIEHLVKDLISSYTCSSINHPN